MDWRTILRNFANAQNRQMSDRELIEQARKSLQGMHGDIDLVIEHLGELKDAIGAALKETGAIQ
jgi:hypothetical protein